MSKLSTPITETILVVNTQSFAGISRIQPYAAGMDIGAREIWVCIPGEGDSQIVRLFGTYTADLHAIGKWLLAHQIRTVAMESTGVYWIPIFEYLESLSFQCCLISSRSIKRVPGRKSDVEDCQWIQTLHSYGLLENSFRPEADLVALRTLLRHRAQLLQHRAPHIQHMQKALLQMNIQLSQALSDVTGQTGQHIIRAIVAGERDPFKLAKLRNYRCKKDEAEIAKALTGTWRDEHLFVLKQALELYDFYSSQLHACDTEIERTYALIRPDWPYDDSVVFPRKRTLPTARMLPLSRMISVGTCSGLPVWTSPLSMESAFPLPRLSFLKSVPICLNGPLSNTSAPGLAWLLRTISLVVKLSAVVPGKRRTALAKLSALQLSLLLEPIAPSALSTDARKVRSALPKPSSPPLT